MNVKFHENYENTGKLLKISCVRCNFGNLTFCEIFCGVITDNQLHLQSFKNAKNNAICS